MVRGKAGLRYLLTGQPYRFLLPLIGCLYEVQTSQHDEVIDASN